MLATPPLPFDTSIPINLERAVGGLERLRMRLIKPIADEVTRQYVRDDFYKQAVGSGVPEVDASKMRLTLANYAGAGVGYDALLESGSKAVHDYLKDAAVSANEAWKARKQLELDLKARAEAAKVNVGEVDETQPESK